MRQVYAAWATSPPYFKITVSMHTTGIMFMTAKSTMNEAHPKKFTLHTVAVKLY